MFRIKPVATAFFIIAAANLTASAAPTLNATISGTAEVVYDWASSRCAEDDIPDVPLRAFRRFDGEILGFASHSSSRRFLIKSDGTFKRDCTVVYRGSENPDPAAFDYRTWLSSFWTTDGKAVSALADNEFHAHKVPGQCRYQSYIQCWYNGITLLSSRNGGASFERNRSNTPIAAAAYRHDAHQGAPRGFFGPTNIVKMGAAYYTLIYASEGGDQARGMCLFRTTDVGDSSAWTYLSDQGYIPASGSGYVNASNRPPCKIIHVPSGRITSVVRHRASGLYIATYTAQGEGQSTGTIGITYSTDLMNWSAPTTLISAQMIWSSQCGTDRFGFASIIDLESGGRNFDEVGDHAFLYLTQAEVKGCAMTLHRNLVRYRIDFR